MKKDILKYFDLITNDFSYGLFEKKLKDRTWNEINNIQFDPKTQFIDAKSYTVYDNITLLDMFHGLCAFYMSYFITKNPDWTPMELYHFETRKQIIHIFAIKQINNVTYFADARGITDNCIEFFSDYNFSKNKMHIHKITHLPELDYDDMILMKKAYDMIYKNKKIQIKKNT